LICDTKNERINISQKKKKKISEEELLRIQNILNHRPLKCLNFMTPYEVIKYALRD